MVGIHSIVLFVIAAHTHTAVACCDDGWVSFQDSCYLFADEVHFDWPEGSHFCASHDNAHIVTIESAEEELFLRDQCRRLFKTDRHNFFYLGAKDDEVEGIWKWYTTNERISEGYVNWAPGQPDHGSTHNQDCAVLWGPSGYLWEDYDCETKAHVICEKPMNSVISVVG